MAEADPGSSLIAVVVTDLVGSTQRRSQVGEVAADRLDRSVHGTSSATVAEHGGIVVKGLGDGLLATFGSAADAVAAAIAVQQSVAAAHEVGLRVGVSVGDVARQADGDVLGLPVVEAARLCAAAETGQILVADVVRLLAHGRAGDVFRSVGALDLKGLPAPLAASAVDWEPLPAQRFPRPRPPVLHEWEALRFIGRHLELGALRRTLRRAEDGGRRVVLVAGEPGVGRSRLVTEALRLQASRRTSLLRVRCRPGAPRFDAVTRLLEGALEDWRATDLDGALGPAAPALAGVVPSIAGRLGLSTDELVQVDDVTDALLRLLRAWAAEGPVFLVVDDADAADPDTRALLAAVAAADQPAGFALVLTHDPSGAPVVDPALATDVLELERLADDEVVRIIEFAAGRSLTDEDHTDLGTVLALPVANNPLYLAHFLRLLRDRDLLVDDGDRVAPARRLTAEDVPGSVEAVIAARIEGLPEGLQAVLATAAADLEASDLDPDALAIACNRPVRDVFDALVHAERLYLLVATDQPGRFAFSHPLVAAVLRA